MLEISQLQFSTQLQWDEYVSQSPQASFFHQTAWGIALREAFGLRSLSLSAVLEGKVVGICPLFLVKDLINGCRLMSVPIGVYGGIVADQPQTVTSLYNRACEVAKELNAHHVEFRSLQPDIYGTSRPSNILPKDTHVTFAKPLPPDKEACLEQMPRKARADVRRSIAEGLVFQEAPHALRTCYQIYSANQKRLGSPTPPYKWFYVLASTFKEQCKIHLVFFKKRPIAGVLSFLFKDQVMPFYGGALKEYYSLHPAGYMYLKLQEWAIEKGFKTFDFGRSRIGSGSYAFKIHQGFSPEPLNYHLAVIDGAAREKCQVRGSWLFQMLSRGIKKSPQPLTNFAGPLIYSKFMP